MRGLLLVLLCSCSAVNKTGATLALASLACDYGQTKYHMDRGWEVAMEGNPILGRTPSPAYLASYFLVTTALLGAAYVALPKEIKWMAYGSVLAAQGPTLYGNHQLPTPLCGIGDT